jgi:hypothetical protein
MRPALRLGIAASYASFVVWPCLIIVVFAHLPKPAMVATVLVYAFALFPTYYLDHWWLGGIGFHSLAVFALFMLVVAVLLWPLPLLSAAPAVWKSRRWRRAILGYGAAFFAYAIVAAWQMTRNAAQFFG